MTIRILCIVAALMAAVWISYEGYVTTAKSYETRVVLSATVKDKYIKDTEYWEES